MNILESSKKLEKLYNFDLEKIIISDDMNIIKLFLSYAGDNKSKTILVLEEVIHFAISKQLPIKKGSLYIGEITINEIKSNSSDILKDLNYGFISNDNDSSPHKNNNFALHLHLEGEIVIDIISLGVNLAEYLGEKTIMHLVS